MGCLSSCTDGAVPEINILAIGLATNIEVDTQVLGETLYIKCMLFKAKAPFG